MAPARTTRKFGDEKRSKGQVRQAFLTAVQQYGLVILLGISLSLFLPSQLAWLIDDDDYEPARTGPERDVEILRRLARKGYLDSTKVWLYQTQTEVEEAQIADPDREILLPSFLWEAAPSEWKNGMFFDPRTEEGLLFERNLRKGREKGGPRNALLAQRIAYAAAAEPDPIRRAMGARRAIRIDPLCTEAYNLLAEQAHTPELALGLYKKATSVGFKALARLKVENEEGLKKQKGNFWKWVPARSLMRAHAGLARTQMKLGDISGATATLEDALEMDIVDGLGLRHLLLSACLKQGEWSKVAELLAAQFGVDKRRDTYSTVFAWTRILVDYQKQNQALSGWRHCKRKDMEIHCWGKSTALNADSEAALTALFDRAMKINPYVPTFLLGSTPILTPFIGASFLYLPYTSDSEAEAYVYMFGPAWLKPPRLLHWLARKFPPNNIFQPPLLLPSRLAGIKLPEPYASKGVFDDKVDDDKVRKLGNLALNLGWYEVAEAALIEINDFGSKLAAVMKGTGKPIDFGRETSPSEDFVACLSLEKSGNYSQAREVAHNRKQKYHMVEDTDDPIIELQDTFQFYLLRQDLLVTFMPVSNDTSEVEGTSIGWESLAQGESLVGGASEIKEMLEERKQDARKLTFGRFASRLPDKLRERFRSSSLFDLSLRLQAYGKEGLLTRAINGHQLASISAIGILYNSPSVESAVLKRYGGMEWRECGMELLKSPSLKPWVHEDRLSNATDDALVLEALEDSLASAQLHLFLQVVMSQGGTPRRKMGDGPRRGRRRRLRRPNRRRAPFPIYKLFLKKLFHRLLNFGKGRWRVWSTTQVGSDESHT